VVAQTRWQGMRMGMGLTALAPPTERGEPPAMRAISA
jgi:hypothetical protein